jgi:Fe(3+) dicitrate transport protein
MYVNLPASASLGILLMLVLLLLGGAFAVSAAEEAGPSPAPAGEASDETADNPSADPPPQMGEAAKEDKLFERVRVVSRPVEKIPGSVAYLDKHELEKQNHTDVNRVLSGVPGVNLQEEDGYGLRPNIGMRGTGVERSQKITLLEDGVLIAPAPYSAPSAYYFPTVARMEGIEVRKGSSSIRQGPYTNGGVLNMMSTSIPSELGGIVDLSLGQDDLRKGKLSIGGAGQTYGWLFETFRMETDGFKDLDGGGSTGFDLEDYMVKVRVNSGARARTFQALELKLGRTDQLGNETYLGLTDQDFDKTPLRRYAASQEDQITSDHEQAHLRYLVRPSRSLDLTTTVYRNDFFRNWHKLQSVSGTGLGTVLADPDIYAHEFAVMRGDVDSADGDLAVRNNRRDYYSQGVQAVVGINPQRSWSGHDWEIGLRYHEDEEDRFQEEDLYSMAGGYMNLSALGDPGSQSNRISSAEAWALFVQDTISLERWTITPGVRFESIDFSRRDFGKNDPERTGSELSVRTSEVDVWIPGVGANYQVTDHSTVFAGVHRGFAPPGPGASPETNPEESVNFEVGYRWSGRFWGGEAVAFYSDYDNLLGSDTLSSGGAGTGDQFNGGAVDVHGLETSVRYDLGRAREWSMQVPVSLTYTYTYAEFLTTFETDFDGWGDVVYAGDELPYLPTHQAALNVGLVEKRWSTYLNLSYADEMRTQAGQGPIPDDEKTDARLLVDLTANYSVHRNVRFYVQVRNLTDEIYVAARRPAGIRPGLPRTLSAGLAWKF